MAPSVLIYLALSANAETQSLILGSGTPLTTLLIVAASLVVCLAFGVALTGFLFALAPQPSAERDRRLSPPHNSAV